MLGQSVFRPSQFVRTKAVQIPASMRIQTNFEGGCSRVLADAGFGGIIRSSYMESAHDALRVDHISAVANAKYGERYYSLFVEARRED